MWISVVICTRNRPASLRRALESLCRLEIPAGLRWELVLVDNGDSDPVAPVAAEFEGRLPLQVFLEPVAGTTHARNRAVQSAMGDWLVWTDDDVVADPRWLAAYVEAITAFPEASFFGGAAAPVFEPPGQPWMERHQDLLHFLLAKRQPQAASPITAEDLPFGLNFATRGDVQRQFPFDLKFGRAPGQSIAGEETDLMRRMLAAGHQGRWVPAAKVSHMIPPHRQTIDYLYEFYAAAGREHVSRHRQELDKDRRGRARVRAKAAILAASRLAPISTRLGVRLRRSHAYNLGVVAALSGD